jgi:hypothetical protein
MFQGKVKTEWLTKGALSPTLADLCTQAAARGITDIQDTEGNWERRAMGRMCWSEIEGKHLLH